MPPSIEGNDCLTMDCLDHSITFRRQLAFHRKEEEFRARRSQPLSPRPHQHRHPGRRGARGADQPLPSFPPALRWEEEEDDRNSIGSKRRGGVSG